LIDKLSIFWVVFHPYVAIPSIPFSTEDHSTRPLFHLLLQWFPTQLLGLIHRVLKVFVHIQLDVAAEQPKEVWQPILR
jgi:hypothetical protein